MTREINAGSKAGDARQRWRTNRRLAAWIAERFEIDLDVMALWHNTIVPRYIGGPGAQLGKRIDPDGITRTCVAINVFDQRLSKLGSSIFVNPEFALLERVVWLLKQASEDGARGVLLAPDNGDTGWYAAIVDAGATVYRFKGRPKYEPDDELVALQDAKSTVDAIFDESAATSAKKRNMGPGFPSALYVLPAFAAPREKGAPIPTFMLDAKTFELL